MNPLDSFTVERLEELVNDKRICVDGWVRDLAKIALAAKLAESGDGKELFKKISNRPADEDGDIYYCVSSNEMLLLESILSSKSSELPDGWVIIPKKATNNMIWAYKEIIDVVGWNTFELAHEAMLAAAPKPDHIVDVNGKDADVSLINEGNNGWIKCSDRMPEPCVEITIRTRHGEVIAGETDVVGFLDLHDGTSVRMTGATHWMPLPAAPKPE